MSELEIIGGPASNFVWVCRIVATEKGVPYTLVPVMPHTPEADAVHPLGKIPAMRHGDVTLAESRAICTYIDRAFPGPSLVPADAAAAARVEQWVSLICTAVDPVLLRRYFAAFIFPGTADGSPNRAAIDAALPVMGPLFTMLDRQVAATGHLVGSGFTLADAYLLPILFYMDKLPEGGAMLRKAEHLRAFLDRHLARKSVAETTPQSWPGKR